MGRWKKPEPRYGAELPSWKGGSIVMAILYRDGVEVAKAHVGRGNRGGVWVGESFMKFRNPSKDHSGRDRMELRYVGTCANEDYGSGRTYDCGQRGLHINYKEDRERYPLKVFVPYDQDQFLGNGGVGFSDDDTEDLE